MATAREKGSTHPNGCRKGKKEEEGRVSSLGTEPVKRQEQQIKDYCLSNFQFSN